MWGLWNNAAQLPVSHPCVDGRHRAISRQHTIRPRATTPQPTYPPPTLLLLHHLLLNLLLLLKISPTELSPPSSSNQSDPLTRHIHKKIADSHTNSPIPKRPKTAETTYNNNTLRPTKQRTNVSETESHPASSDQTLPRVTPPRWGPRAPARLLRVACAPNRTMHTSSTAASLSMAEVLTNDTPQSPHAGRISLAHKAAPTFSWNRLSLAHARYLFPNRERPHGCCFQPARLHPKHRRCYRHLIRLGGLINGTSARPGYPAARSLGSGRVCWLLLRPQPYCGYKSVYKRHNATLRRQ